MGFDCSHFFLRVLFSWLLIDSWPWEGSTYESCSHEICDCHMIFFCFYLIFSFLVCMSMFTRILKYIFAEILRMIFVVSWGVLFTSFSQMLLYLKHLASSFVMIHCLWNILLYDYHLVSCLFILQFLSFTVSFIQSYWSNFTVCLPHPVPQ